MATAAAASATSMLAIGLLRRDGGTQPRDQIDQKVAEEYAEAIADGSTLPPVTVFFDGTDYWLADGFHRAAAHDQLGLSEIAADVLQGTRRDAILYSTGANASHGYRRSNADKRRAVLTLMNDPEWSEWSDREIARRCSVSNHLVADLRSQALTGNSPSDRTYTTKHGTVATMNTTAIGKKASSTGGNMAPAQAAKAAPRNPSPKLLLPDDAADIVELCRTGIEREATGQSSESVADELGLNRAAYRYSRMIVMLSDRSELSASDRAAVDEALNVLTSTLQYGRAWELAEPVAIKLWGGNQRWDRITTLADRRMEQFERTFGIVIQSCVTTDEIELPYLSAEQIKQFTREIGRARRALAAFSTRIEEIHQ